MFTIEYWVDIVLFRVLRWVVSVKVIALYCG